MGNKLSPQWHRLKAWNAERKRRRDLYWENRRKQALAAHRRRQRIANMGAVQRARMERRERSREQRRRAAYSRPRGIFINICAAMHGQRGEGNMKWLIIAALLIMWFLFVQMIPIMIMAGVISILAEKMFELPGIKDLVGILATLLCNDLTQKLLDVLGDDNGPLGWISDAMDFVGGLVKDVVKEPFSIAADGLSAIGWQDGATGLLWIGDKAGDMTASPVTIVKGMADAVQMGAHVLKSLTEFLCWLNNELLDKGFHKIGLDDPLRAASSCANWSQIEPFEGPLKMKDSGGSDNGNMTSGGTPKYCWDGKNKSPAQSMIPEWLVPIYVAAGNQYNVPWQMVAAVNWNDTNYGARELNDSQKHDKWSIDYRNSSFLQDMNELKHSDDTFSSISDERLQSLMQQAKQSDKKKAREAAKQSLESTKEVIALWQQPNPDMHNRVGWIPLDKKEWDEAGVDAGNVTPDWGANPYDPSGGGSSKTGIADRTKQACPMPLDTDGQMAAGASAGATDKQGLKGPFEGIATVYDPSQGGINGREGAGSWGVPLYHDGYILAKLGNEINIPGWKYPQDNWAYHGWMVRLINTKNNRSVEVPFIDIGPGEKVPPSSDSVAKGFNPKNMPRIVDMLPKVARLLDNGDENTGTADNLHVKVVPLRKISKAEAAPYGNGTKKPRVGNGTGSYNAADVQTDFTPDGSSDTCDPVDSIFSATNWFSKHGATGDTWKAALVGTEAAPLQGKKFAPVTMYADAIYNSVQGDVRHYASSHNIDVRSGRIDRKGDEEVSKMTTGDAVNRFVKEVSGGEDARPHKIVVIGVGAFDDASGAGRIRGWIRQVVDAAGPRRCVVWPVSAANFRPRYLDALLAEERRNDRFVVPRWDIGLGQHLESRKDDARGIFPNKAGSMYLGRITGEGINKCAGGTGNPAASDITAKGEAVSYGASVDNDGNVLKRDPGDSTTGKHPKANGVECNRKEFDNSVRAHRLPGISVAPEGTPESGHVSLCGWWFVKAPNGRSAYVQQISLGPKNASGAKIGLNERAGWLFGYKWHPGAKVKAGNWKAIYVGQNDPAGNDGNTGTRPSSASIVGDSLLDTKGPNNYGYDMEKAFKNRLRGWDIAFRAKGGMSTPWGLDQFKKNPKLQLNSVLVFALGTNNNDSLVSYMRNQIKQVMDLAGPDRCVVLPTVSVYTDGLSQPNRQKNFNKLVREAKRKYGDRVVVAEWDQLVRDRKVILGDGIHPRDETGLKKRADLLSKAAKKCLGGAGQQKDGPKPEMPKVSDLMDGKVPPEFDAKAMPPLAELKKKNSKLPDADWVHKPEPPLETKFPSFKSGLQGRFGKSTNCSQGISDNKQLKVFYSGGHAFNLPWQLLAAYAGVKSNFGCRKGNNVEFSPVQDGYETDAGGDGKFTADDPVDATFSTARNLYALGGDKDPIKAMRTMAGKDFETLRQVAYAARQMGYSSDGLVELLDEGTSQAVAERNDKIDKDLCPDQEKYVECIAHLYRKLVGAEEDTDSPGDWLTGGCNPEPIPDLSLKEYSLDKQARKGANAGAYAKMKTLKNFYTETSMYSMWGRKDAQIGESAAVRTFVSCYPKWAKRWKTNVRIGEWGAGEIKHEWRKLGNHDSHNNGGDNDLNIDGVTNMADYNGMAYEPKMSMAMGRMLFRAGAVKIFFNDTKVQDDIAKARAAALKKHPEVKKKLGDRMVDRPMSTWPLHEDHFHVRWYHSASIHNDIADVKIWVTNKSMQQQGLDECVKSVHGKWVTVEASHTNVECRDGKNPTVIVIHTTEGLYNNSLNSLFADLQSRYLSIHAANTTTGRSARMIDDSLSAQHATYWNETSVGIEQIGFAATSRSSWLTNRRAQLDNTAAWIAYWAQKFNIPLHNDSNRCRVSGIKYSGKRVSAGTASGVCAHGKLDPKNRNDPGDNYPWDYVMGKAIAFKNAGQYKDKDPAGGTSTAPPSGDCSQGPHSTGKGCKPKPKPKPEHKSNSFNIKTLGGARRFGRNGDSVLANWCYTLTNTGGCVGDFKHPGLGFHPEKSTTQKDHSAALWVVSQLGCYRTSTASHCAKQADWLVMQNALCSARISMLSSRSRQMTVGPYAPAINNSPPQGQGG